MLDLNTPIILNGEHETTIAEFLADNADGFQDWRYYTSHTQMHNVAFGGES